LAVVDKTEFHTYKILSLSMTVKIFSKGLVTSYIEFLTVTTTAQY